MKKALRIILLLLFIGIFAYSGWNLATYYLAAHQQEQTVSGLRKQLVEEDPESDVARDLANLLYDSSLMNSGFMIDEPNEFATRLYGLMKESLQLDSLDLEPEVEVPEEPEEPEKEEEEDENTIKFDSSNSEQMDEEEFRAQLKKDREQSEEEDEL